jgi:hypothetical protein
MMDNNPLACIICGYERGGTTLISQLIRQHPDIDGRFECGFLLVNDLKDFADLGVYVRNLKAGWGLSNESFEYIIQAPSHLMAYQRLIEHSNLPDKNLRIYDKTPKYMEDLSAILEKMNVPCVCVVRDPRAVYWSQQKRWDQETLMLGRLTKFYVLSKRLPLPNFTRRWSDTFFNNWHKANRLNIFSEYYLKYARGWQEAECQYPDRTLLVRFEEVCSNPKEETQRMYDFLGLEFKTEYLDFPTAPDAIVDRGGILKDPIYEYREGLSKDDQKRILRKTMQCSEWHWRN